MYLNGSAWIWLDLDASKSILMDLDGSGWIQADLCGPRWIQDNLVDPEGSERIQFEGGREGPKPKVFPKHLFSVSYMTKLSNSHVLSTLHDKTQNTYCVFPMLLSENSDYRLD